MRRCVAAIIIGVCLFSFGCTSKNGPENDAESLTNEGWRLYEQGQYSEALQKFNEAISADANYADAYNGQGWSNAELDNLSGSVTSFGDCISNDASIADAYAGLALVNGDLADFAESIYNADELISREPNYAFSHKTSITIEDIRLVKAKSCCSIGDFSTALSEIQGIEASFYADPYTTEGQQAILEKIEELISLYS